MPSAQRLNQTLTAFIERQPLFFVATAAQDGRVNLSPKGLETLQVKGPQRIVWLNLTGSGNETAAHVRALPRMTLMFCAFEGSAMILRVYGTTRVVHPGADDWSKLVEGFPAMAGARQIFDLRVDLVQTSCGTGVPIMTHAKQRGHDELLPFYAEMGPERVRDYWLRKNRLSLDGAETGIDG